MLYRKMTNQITDITDISELQGLANTVDQLQQKMSTTNTNSQVKTHQIKKYENYSFIGLALIAGALLFINLVE